MLFSDLALSRRLERAEGEACVRFAIARRKLFPESGAEWIERAGAHVVFDGIDSPATQTFGIGLFEELTEESLAAIEQFFQDRGSPVLHEVSPLAGPATLRLLCARGYRPHEISNVLYRQVEPPRAVDRDNIQVRLIRPDEGQLWSTVSARGWGAEHPELLPSIRKFGSIAAAREGSPCFIAEIDREPGAAGSLNIYGGVALFGGAATVPELRRRGLHTALLDARMDYAFEHGCDVAMIVTEAGSESQRNAERKGFRVAYTRIKWKSGG